MESDQLYYLIFVVLLSLFVISSLTEYWILMKKKHEEPGQTEEKGSCHVFFEWFVSCLVSLINFILAYVYFYTKDMQLDIIYQLIRFFVHAYPTALILCTWYIVIKNEKKIGCCIILKLLFVSVTFIFRCICFQGNNPQQRLNILLMCDVIELALLCLPMIVLQTWNNVLAASFGYLPTMSLIFAIESTIKIGINLYFGYYKLDKTKLYQEFDSKEELQQNSQV